MEFISNITLLIDEDQYGDPGRLKRILGSYSARRTASCYRVTGSLEELEQLVARLGPGEARPGPDEARPGRDEARSGPDELRAFQNHRSVSVSRDTMDYIQNKCQEKLQKISGERFVLDVQPGRSGSRSSVLVLIRPRGALNPARLDFVKQRFIDLYQRTSSDLQVKSFQLGSARLSDLSETFPRLLFRREDDQNQVTVTGPFPHVAKLQDFLSDRNRGTPVPEPCPICMEPIEVGQTLRCRHSFCRACLQQSFALKPVCPVCGRVYGVLRGVQPEGGTMDVRTKSSSLPGYDKHGTIIIRYHIPDGIQKEEHPNPGQPYEGASRTAYLPDSPEGLEVLSLLRRAFTQRLVFTVGRSTTSGRNNTVTWNDVHHKTSTHGGPSHYGYPDPDYLHRVREELKAKGIE